MGDAVIITCEQLRDALAYDPATGQFLWRHDRTTTVKAGSVAGCLTVAGYWQIRVAGVSYKAHRLAWLYVRGDWPTHEVDHIDGDRSNNRISNLRDVSRSINAQNQRRAQKGNASTGVLGVYRNKGRRRCCARIMWRGKRLFLGQFATAEEAHAAYVLAKRSLHEGCTL